MKRGIVWKVGHAVYENRYARRVVAPIVNLFKPVFVMVGKNKMYIDKNDRVVSLALILDGVWEEYETELFRKNIRSGNTVLDIGANIGYHTLIAAEKVGPRGQVFAFEPHPGNFQLLKKNVEINGYKNVKVVNKALSDHDGVGKLYLSCEDNFGDLRIFDSGDKRRSINIELVKLDTFWGGRIPKIDVVKMDVQGAEVAVLTGAAKTLTMNQKIKMFCEFWPKALQESGSSAKEYADVLKKNRFELFEINAKDKSVTKTTLGKLLEVYPEESMYNADLLCIK